MEYITGQGQGEGETRNSTRDRARHDMMGSEENEGKDKGKRNVTWGHNGA